MIGPLQMTRLVTLWFARIRELFRNPVSKHVGEHQHMSVIFIAGFNVG